MLGLKLQYSYCAPREDVKSMATTAVHFDELAEAKAAHRQLKSTPGFKKHSAKEVVHPQERRVLIKLTGYEQDNLSESVKAAYAALDAGIPYRQTRLSNGDWILRYCVDVNTRFPTAAAIPAVASVCPASKDAAAHTAAVPGAASAAAVAASASGEIAKPRAAFIAARGANPQTQLEYAKAGIITPEMVYVALRESAANLEYIQDKSAFRGKFKDIRDGAGAVSASAASTGNASAEAASAGAAASLAEATVIELDVNKLSMTPDRKSVV